MISPEWILKIQSHLDGELSEAESREVTQRLANDPEARALADELQATQAMLRAGELARPVPESRDFYWSKIQRAIQSEEKAAAPARAASTPFWLRFLASSGAIAALALVLLSVNRITPGRPLLPRPHSGTMIVDNTSDAVSTITFRSEEAGLTLVWVNND